MFNFSFPRTIDNQIEENFWNTFFLPMVLPLLLGFGLGPLVALLIVRENLIITIAIPFLIPLAIIVVRYPFASIMIWLIVMPWFPLQGAYKFVYFSVHYTLIPVTLVLVILTRMLRLKEYMPLRVRLAELATIGFAAMGILSILITGQGLQTILALHARVLIPFTAYWLIRMTRTRKQDVKHLLPLIIFLTVAECVIGLLSWFAPQVLPSIWHKRLLGSRVSGTFDGAGPFGFTLIFFMVFLYHEAMNRKKDRVRTLLLLIFGLGSISLFFTFTRAVWGSSLLALVGLLYLYPKKTASLMGIIVGVMLIIAPNLLSSEVSYAVQRLTQADETARARIVLANAGKKMFYARPIFGWGFASYDLYDWKFMERVEETTPTKWQVKQGTSHHTYITILAEMGMVGLLLYAFPVIWWLGRTVKVLPKILKDGYWSRRLLIILWLPIIVQIVIGQTSDFRFAYYAVTLFWINLGLIANLIESLYDLGEHMNSIDT